MMPYYRAILHPTDFSEPAMYAFALARAIAKASRAELLVLNVAPYRHRPKRRHRREAEEALRRLTAVDPGVRMYPLLSEGDPASKIVSGVLRMSCSRSAMP